ncbi:MAG: hypothetical protein WD227_05260 [Vicinamibacterales bacterium]
MVPLSSLLVPILLSAVIVFVASSIIHMVLTYHRSDFRGLAKEDEVMEAIRRAGVPPGDYMAPHAGSMAGMKDPGFVERMKRGPILIMTVAPGGAPSMAAPLAMWFGYSLLVSLFAGYIASRALGPTAYYLDVFRFVGTSAFMGYSFGLLQNSIWYKRNWGTTLKSVFDGLVYALLTAGTFGWLWPR